MTINRKIPTRELKRRERERPRFYTDPEGDSLTQQSMRDECNINNIVKKANRTGFVAHVNKTTGSMRDLSDATDYKTSLDLINAADEAFSELPSAVRKRFDNDPAEMLDFLDEPENYDEAVKLGLVEKTSETDEKSIPDALGKNAVKPLEAEPETPRAQDTT